MYIYKISPYFSKLCCHCGKPYSMKSDNQLYVQREAIVTVVVIYLQEELESLHGVEDSIQTTGVEWGRKCMYYVGLATK